MNPERPRPGGGGGPWAAALLLSSALHAGAFWLGSAGPAPLVEIDLTRPITAGFGPTFPTAAAGARRGAPARAGTESLTAAPLGNAPFASGRLPTEPGGGTPSPQGSVGERPLSGDDAPLGNAPFASGERLRSGDDAPLGNAPGGAPGEGAWSAPVRPPRLLHAEKVRAQLRRLYPESERRAGREGEVVADLRVDAEGRVASFEIVRSAGAAFDEAAGKLLGGLRFSPAMAGTRPAPVKVRQRVRFRLRG